MSENLKIFHLTIPDVKLLYLSKHSDNRGFLSETYNKLTLADTGVELEFVQENHVLSTDRGTVRGLHFQTPPQAQHKLIRVARGAIFDVAVDLRWNSSTFGRHVSAVISAARWNQILVPGGFAHGFCTLEPDTEVIYKVTDFFAPSLENGCLWNDPELGIDWPVDASTAIVSEKDINLPRLSELTDDLFKSLDERS
jgi:dTDP-4-dehydrorhamnose 3,5-epimerase